ncbi:uncharacterized protein LOC122626722 isoform X1 [Drosophila teissieri]|uniref:uncharacterized protein LOC122626722 isoform X1 n=1 Tax=Drosophila teissieri TaxID=7243 RepID=UPI001CBA2D5C|nr:uncharacterized protein LOC122626722 isoform X1 [Drosophila teissieri]
MCSTSHRHGFISSDLSAVRSPLLFADLFRSTPPPIFLRIIDGHGDRHRHVAQAQVRFSPDSWHLLFLPNNGRSTEKDVHHLSLRRAGLYFLPLYEEIADPSNCGIGLCQHSAGFVCICRCTGTDVQDPLAKKSPPDRKAGSGSANAPPTATGKTMRNKARCH